MTGAGLGILDFEESHYFSGLWWRPEAPEEQIPGQLIYKPEEGLTLRLERGLEDSKLLASQVISFTAEERSWPVLWGKSEYGKFTLFGSSTHGESFRHLSLESRQPAPQRIDAQYLVWGAHVSGPEEAVFSAVEVSADGMEQWCGTRPNPEADPRLLEEVLHETERSQGTYFQLKSSLEPSSAELEGQARAMLPRLVSVRAAVEVPMSFHGELDQAHEVSTLIAVATHSSVATRWLNAELASSQSQEGMHVVAHVLYRQRTASEPGSTEIKTSRMLLTCNEVPFGTLMPLWHEKFPHLKRALGMLLSLRKERVSFTETTLLISVGAAEVLHRDLRLDKPPFPKDEFKKFRATVLEQLPEHYRAHFNEEIRNESRLRDRLILLATRLGEGVAQELVPDVAYWAAQASKARNNLAHTGRSTGHSYEQMDTISATTRAFLVLNVLHELGLPSKTLKNKIQTHPWMSWTRITAKRHLHPVKMDVGKPSPEREL